MKILRYLVNKMRRRIPALLVLIAANVGVALLAVSFALGTKGVIDGAVSGGRTAFVHACWVQAAIIAGLLLCLFVARWLHARLTDSLDRDWKQSLIHRLLRGNYADIAEYHSGELINRLTNDVRIVNDGLLSTLPNLASMATRLVAVVAVLAAMAPWFTLGMVLFGIAAALTTGFVRKYVRSLHKNVSAANGRVSGFLQEVLEKLMLVQAMNVAPEVEKRSDILMDERWQIQTKKRRFSLTASTCVSLLSYGSSFAALVWCGVGVYRGDMTFGELTAVTQLVSQLQAPLVNLTGVIPQFMAMTAACERLMELDDLGGDEDSPPSHIARALYDDMDAICARELSFSYGRDQVLEKSDFRLPKEAFTVVVGPSGIGKSTLLKLMLGIFRPESGRLYLDLPDGEKELTAATRSLFAYVPQGNLLFSGTLRENLTLTCPGASEEDIQQAVYISGMDAFLPQLPDGLETVLGENAHGLSEGQAQRLAIARAILGGAPILLLDEVTSALDAETEQLVLERIRELPGRTCIAVTHRPAALALADWELMIDENGIQCRKLKT